MHWVWQVICPGQQRGDSAEINHGAVTVCPRTCTTWKWYLTSSMPWGGSCRQYMIYLFYKKTLDVPLRACQKPHKHLRCSKVQTERKGNLTAYINIRSLGQHGNNLSPLLCSIASPQTYGRLMQAEIMACCFGKILHKCLQHQPFLWKSLQLQLYKMNRVISTSAFSSSSGTVSPPTCKKGWLFSLAILLLLIYLVKHLLICLLQQCVSPVALARSFYGPWKQEVLSLCFHSTFLSSTCSIRKLCRSCWSQEVCNFRIGKH